MPQLTRPEGSEPGDFNLSRRAALAAGAVGAAFVGYAPAGLAQDAQPIQTPTDGLEVADVSYPSADGFDLPAYVARPAGEGPFPVIIVVSEIFGVHDYIRDVCRRLAKDGYAAIAPAFFVRAGDPAPLTDMAQIRQIVAAAGYEQVMGDVNATLEWAGGQLWANTEKVGITGFCWGGKVVWQACARFAAFDAGVAWYGRLAPAPDATPEQTEAGRPWPVDLAADLKCPVLGLYGEADQGIPVSSVDQMQQALIREGKADSTITVYPDAPHAFHADYRPSYREGPAQDGWGRLLALFEVRLKGEA